MKVKVLGISSYEKDGKKCFNLYYAKLFPDHQVSAGALGIMTASSWTNSVDLSVVEPGMFLELYFEPGFQDRATLSDFKVLSGTPFNSKEDALASAGLPVEPLKDKK